MVSEKKIAQLQKIIDEGKKIVFFTGAGVQISAGDNYQSFLL